jgi:hypothetical protein
VDIAGRDRDTAPEGDTAAVDTALEGDIVPAADTALVVVGGTAPESGAADREQAESDPVFTICHLKLSCI